MVIQIKKCNNDTLEGEEKPCAPIEVINEYVRDVSVDTWVLHENIDFSIYGEKPVFSIMRFLSSNLLNPDFVSTQFVFLR